MRFAYLLIAVLTGLAFSAPAMAGKVSYADGKGRWVSTNCALPAGPVEMPRDPEAAADDLNARVAAHNRFVADAEVYMSCISKEAQNDAEAFSQLITNSAQSLIDKMQKDVAASSARVSAKPAVK
jgi:hypothetical protein